LDIKINSAGKVRCAPDWHWEPRLIDYDLWVVLDGAGDFYVEGESRNYRLGPGDKCLGDTDTDSPLLVVYAHFEFGNKPEIIPALHRKIGNLPLFSGLLERLVLRYMDGKNLEAADWLKVILHEMNAQDALVEKSKPEQDPIRCAIENLKAEILEYPEKKYSIKEISAQTFCCRDHFSRIFKEISGLSFRDFLMSVRMERAKYLLSATESRVGRIASLCGYRDIYLFSRQFKLKTGFSPLGFRRRSKDSVFSSALNRHH